MSRIKIFVTKPLMWVLTAVLMTTPFAVLAKDAREIVKDMLDRDDGYSQYARQTIATCKYEIKNRKLSCVDKPRVKVVENVQKDVGENSKDSQSVTIIKKPNSEKGIGFLQYDYDESGKDTDQWMYLSALGKIKRIVSGNDNEPKTGTLFGSEFSYEDTEKLKLDEYSYQLVKEDKYNGRESWVVESRPVPKHARKSNYSKSLMWIDKERSLLLKSKLFDRRGKLIKQLAFSKFRKINNIWVAQKLNMNNVQTRRISTMKLNNIALNIDIDNSMLTQRMLTDSSFREKQLKVIRGKTQ